MAVVLPKEPPLRIWVTSSLSRWTVSARASTGELQPLLGLDGSTQLRHPPAEEPRLKGSPSPRLVGPNSATAKQAKGASKEEEQGGEDQMRWNPGHEAVEGNEAADMEAKRAAIEEKSNADRDLPKLLRRELPTSKSAEKMQFNRRIGKASARRWQEYAEGKYMAKTAPDFPTKKHIETLEDLTRKGGSIWSQLKPGHIGLNKHLFRINVVESSRCPKCDKYKETVEHFLLYCVAYKSERRKLKNAVKSGLKNLKRLLGNHKNTKLVVKYVHATGRLRWATNGQQAEQEAEQEGTQGDRERRIENEGATGRESDRDGGRGGTRGRRGGRGRGVQGMT